MLEKLDLNVEIDADCLVPGDGGSQFEARLDKPSVVHRYCVRKADWFELWLNLELLAPYVFDCFIDNMKSVVIDCH